MPTSRLLPHLHSEGQRPRLTWPRRAAACAVSAMLLCGAAQAQLVAIDPDWSEGDVPPPPAYSLDKLVPFETDRQTQLRYGVDPATLSITPNGIVRYVMVAQSASGARNVWYEGVRCSTAQVRTYARQSPDGTWNTVKGSEWRDLRDPAPSRHAFYLSKAGLCMGAAPAQTVADIVKGLRLGRSGADGLSR